MAYGFHEVEGLLPPQIQGEGQAQTLVGSKQTHGAQGEEGSILGIFSETLTMGHAFEVPSSPQEFREDSSAQTGIILSCKTVKRVCHRR